MTENPRYPNPGEDGGLDPGPPRRPVQTYLVVALVALVLVAFVVLHVTGVLGPGEH